jgi:hypothetical protein
VITVECPHCERTVVGSDSIAGQYRECPNCGELFVALPGAQDSAADSSEGLSSVDGEIQLPAPSRRRSSRIVATDNDPPYPERPDVEFDHVEDGTRTELDSVMDLADSLPDIKLEFDDAEPEEGELLSPWKQVLQSKESRSYVISTAVHAIILLVLAAWILPELPATNLSEIITVLPSVVEDNGIESVDFDAETDEDKDDPALDPVEANAVPLTIQPNVFDASEAGGLQSITATQDAPRKSDTAADSNTGPGSSEPAAEPREAKVSQAKSVEGATDAIIESIKAKLLERDMAVIWLMDRSVSMQRQRNMLADRLEGYLQEVHETRTDESHTLMHIVVAFGARPEKLTVTTVPGKALAAIRKDYGLDATGLENVFSAIEWSEEQFVQKNGKNRSKNLMCVVCTDESGDDYLRLERTIQICRNSRLEVSVIGPSAVLGQMQGYHAFQAEDDRVYYLPVVRGPDTALRQRLRLPYWFRNVPANWDESKRGPWYGKSPAWQGGSNLDAMLSGFGPYALTRLTMATGGNYIVYDRPSDSSPFRIDTLRPYLPDYRSADLIQADLRERPLRVAVLKAVEAAHKLNLQPPRLDYGVRFGGPFYYTAQEFQARLGSELASEKRKAEVAVRDIDELIRVFENRVVVGLYEQETSPRWQAWHDLTYGRLIAARTRYRAFVDFAPRLRPGTLKSSTNGLTIHAARPSRVERTTRGEDAKRILKRCIDAHPNTPWFHLAQRELAHDFGFAVQERAVIRVPRNRGRPTRQVSLPRL